MSSKPSQCAVITYRVNADVVEILLVTTRGGSGWIIPKGKIDDRLGPRESALREAFEEGGVAGVVHTEPFGHYRHGSNNGNPLVVVYLMRATDEHSEWPESHERERRWSTIPNATRLVLDPDLISILKRADKTLSKPPSQHGWLQRLGLGALIAAVIKAVSTAGLCLALFLHGEWKLETGIFHLTF